MGTLGVETGVLVVKLGGLLLHAFSSIVRPELPMLPSCRGSRAGGKTVLPTKPAVMCSLTPFPLEEEAVAMLL